MVPFHNLLADSQANTGAGILLLAMQTLEYCKYALIILRIDSYAIVANGNNNSLFILFRRYMNTWRSFITVFDRVAYEILEYLSNLYAVSKHGRHRIMRNHCAAILYRHPQIPDCMIKNCFNIYLFKISTRRSHARISKQVMYKLLHAFRAVNCIVNKVICIVIEFVLVTPLQ